MKTEHEVVNKPCLFWTGEDARRSIDRVFGGSGLSLNFASEKLHQEAQFPTIAGVLRARIFKGLRARPSTSVPSLVP